METEEPPTLGVKPEVALSTCEDDKRSGFQDRSHQVTHSPTTGTHHQSH